MRYVIHIQHPWARLQFFAFAQRACGKVKSSKSSNKNNEFNFFLQFKTCFFQEIPNNQNIFIECCLTFLTHTFAFIQNVNEWFDKCVSKLKAIAENQRKKINKKLWQHEVQSGLDFFLLIFCYANASYTLLNNDRHYCALCIRETL